MDITRSRKGCWTCRSRRIKCDEIRPVCDRCSRGNLACGYDIRLTWQEDNDARGLCHGRAGVWSKAEKRNDASKKRRSSMEGLSSPPFPRIAEAKFLNTTVKDVQMHLGDYEEHQDTDIIEGDIFELDDWDLMQYEDLCPDPGTPQQALSLISHPSKSSQHDPMLLSYYEAVICSSSTLLDDEKNNPYRHVLLPMALQTPGVYHATLAISANILRLARSEYAVVALDHRQRALQRLIVLLNNGNVDSREMDEILGLVLLLCWWEISDGCSPSWVKHLKGFRSLINRHRQISSTGSLHSLHLEQFFLRYFAFHLVLAKTTFQVDELDAPADAVDNRPGSATGLDPTDNLEFESQIFESSEAHLGISPSTSFLSVHMPQDSIDNIDPYMGFSNSLLLLINEISDLAHLANGAGNRGALLTKARLLKTSLDNLQQHLPEFPTSDSGPATRRPAFIATAESYRLGAIVLLHEVLSQSHTAMIGHVTITASELNTAIKSILQIIDTHLDDMIHTAALPLWPLFLAGCCVDREEDRVTALRLFEITEERKRFGNITPAREVMEMVWRQRDLGRDQRRSATRRTADHSTIMQYEWERASMLLGGWKISLT